MCRHWTSLLRWVKHIIKTTARLNSRPTDTYVHSNVSFAPLSLVCPTDPTTGTAIHVHTLTFTVQYHSCRNKSKTEQVTNWTYDWWRHKEPFQCPPSFHLCRLLAPLTDVPPVEPPEDSVAVSDVFMFPSSLLHDFKKMSFKMNRLRTSEVQHCSTPLVSVLVSSVRVNQLSGSAGVRGDWHRCCSHYRSCPDAGYSQVRRKLQVWHQR